MSAKELADAYVSFFCQFPVEIPKIERVNDYTFILTTLCNNVIHCFTQQPTEEECKKELYAILKLPEIEDS